jgi:DNA topoisomerase-2
MYREFLETLLDKSPMCKKPLLKDIRDEYNDLDVKFTLEFLPGILSPLVSGGKLSKVLDLDTALHTNNMWLYDSRGRLRRYDNVEEIMDEFVVERLRLYAERKDAILRELRREHTMISAKALFIKLVCEDIIDIRGSDDSKLAEVLRENKLPELDKSSGLATRDVLAGWKYLMILPVRTLTPTKREQLLKEVGELESKISTIEASTVQSMWEADLIEFEEAYKDYLKERDTADNDARNEVVVKKSSSVKRSRNTKLHIPPVASGAGVSHDDD